MNQRRKDKILRNRKSQYKKKIDSGDGKKKRIDASFAIRRRKKKHQLTKRRGINVDCVLMENHHNSMGITYHNDELYSEMNRIFELILNESSRVNGVRQWQLFAQSYYKKDPTMIRNLIQEPHLVNCLVEIVLNEETHMSEFNDVLQTCLSSFYLMVECCSNNDKDDEMLKFIICDTRIVECLLMTLEKSVYPRTIRNCLLFFGNLFEKSGPRYLSRILSVGFLHMITRLISIVKFRFSDHQDENMKMMENEMNVHVYWTLYCMVSNGFEKHADWQQISIPILGVLGEEIRFHQRQSLNNNDWTTNTNRASLSYALEIVHHLTTPIQIKCNNNARDDDREKTYRTITGEHPSQCLSHRQMIALVLSETNIYQSIYELLLFFHREMSVSDDMIVGGYLDDDGLIILEMVKTCYFFLGNLVEGGSNDVILEKIVPIIESEYFSDFFHPTRREVTTKPPTNSQLFGEQFLMNFDFGIFEEIYRLVYNICNTLNDDYDDNKYESVFFNPRTRLLERMVGKLDNSLNTNTVEYGVNMLSFLVDVGSPRLVKSIMDMDGCLFFIKNVLTASHNNENVTLKCEALRLLANLIGVVFCGLETMDGSSDNNDQIKDYTRYLNMIGIIDYLINVQYTTMSAQLSDLATSILTNHFPQYYNGGDNDLDDDDNLDFFLMQLEEYNQFGLSEEEEEEDDDNMDFDNEMDFDNDNALPPKNDDGRFYSF